MKIKTLEVDYYMGLGHVTYKTDPPKWSKNTKASKPTPPKLAEVLHSWLLESQAAHQSFKDWCLDFGYGTDSITARATYEQCRETYYDFRLILSEAELKELEQTLQDF